VDAISRRTIALLILRFQITEESRVRRVPSSRSKRRSVG